MNALLWAIIVVIWLISGYKIYGRFIDQRLVEPDDHKQTPAHSKNDGVDYSPAKTSLLFGHHFSSIAGAGPIVGPLLGVMYFGWLAASLWIAIGSVFIGAVHDYLSLMVSVRNGGSSIADVAQLTLGKRSKTIFAVFLWLTLLLVIAIFGIVTAKTFVSQPEIVIPTFGLIFVAMVFGTLVYKRGVNIVVGTIVAIGMLALLLYIGNKFPVILPDKILGMSSAIFWFWVLMIYALFASILPVWFLLQPRDYLSTSMLFIGLGLGYLGLVLTRPVMNAPSFVSFTSAKGDPLWPMLMVIIACGAVSGFHSLVSGGTSSKQLDKERKGKIIGYGAMITEAVLAILVVTIAAGALIWDPSAVKSEFGYQYLMGAGGGPIVAFATGYGKFLSSIPGFTMVAGVFIGMLMLNAFVITTLDTSTRLARFLIGELFGFKGLGNRWTATIITILLAAYLGASGSYSQIWPVFGATNQLVAALALIVVSSYLVGIRKPRIYTVIPAIFMLVTTIAALIYQMVGFFGEQQYVLGVLSIILTLLALFIAYEARGILLFIQSEKIKRLTESH
ncbi:MAG: carbon starvation protein A [candidate division Zixibacteria bacterium]|nr:carbon starvation protein A [candidate division Zixibacteria bacterium]